MAAGLLILRVVVGALLVGHGTQKLFGWFGGHGPDGGRRARRRSAHAGWRRSLTTRAGAPATIAKAGTSWVTTAWAPTMALGPTVTPSRTIEPAPSQPPAPGSDSG